MSKKRALLFFGILTLLILAYVAWSTRWMYLHVPVPGMTELPAEYREDAKAAIREYGLTRPNRFAWEDVAACLLRPFDVRKEVSDIHVFTKMNPELEVGVTRGRPARRFHADDHLLIFYRLEEGWRLGVFPVKRGKIEMTSSRMLEKR